MAKNTIGARIAQARERAGFNKNRFARELGTSWQHVDHWEKGRTEPSLGSLIRIAEVLGISVDVLLGVRATGPGEVPSALDRFLRELAPQDLSDDEEEWLRRAPLDRESATPNDYQRMLEGVRVISARKTAREDRPVKSGRRPKVDPAALERAIRTRKGAAR